MSDTTIIPGAPFIPGQPPTIIQRQIIEWKDRADLARLAYLDGQWRVLMTWEDMGIHMLERWVPCIEDGLREMQHAIVPIEINSVDLPAPHKKWVSNLWGRWKDKDGEGLQDKLIGILYRGGFR